MRLISLVILIKLISVLSKEYSNLTDLSTQSRSKRSRYFYSNRFSPTTCHKTDFYVNFYELGWDKWIIFPKVFNAHICSGGCGLPKIMSFMNMKRSNRKRMRHLPKSLVNKLTNHAQIMSILEYRYPQLNKQMTKCVPTRLKPLTVIYLNEIGRIMTKQYEDMVVEECGCR